MEEAKVQDIWEATAQVVHDHVFRTQNWSTFGKCPDVSELAEVIKDGYYASRYQVGETTTG